MYKLIQQITAKFYACFSIFLSLGTLFGHKKILTIKFLKTLRVFNDKGGCSKTPVVIKVSNKS